MLLELLKNYADMINSATRMTQRSATAMARTMLIQAGMEPAAEMVSKLSEQMIAAQEAQYAMMRRMIQTEVDMTVARMGVLPAGGGNTQEETAAEPGAPEVTKLEPVRQARQSAPAKEEATKPTSTVESPAADRATEQATVTPEPAAGQNAAAPPAEPDTETKPASAKKAPAKRTAAKKTTARTTTAPRKASATKSAATKSAQAKSTAKKASAKSTAKKAPAKAASTRSTSEGTSGDGSAEGSKADS